MMRGLALISVAFVVALSSCGCERKESVSSGSVQRTVDVTVVTVTPRDVPVAFEFIGQAQSSRQVNINARISGFLEKRVYTEGAIVKEGETLFLMDQKPFKVQLDQAVAALAKQEAALKIASQNLSRVKPLTELNALSQKDLDDANGQFQSASAAVDQARAQVEQAKLNLSYTVITSPVEGITSSALQADGSYINQTNSQLTTVAVLSPIWVNFSASENQMQGFRDQVAKGLVREPEGKKYLVEIILVDDSIFPHTGLITFAEPSFNPQTGTFLIRASVENPKGTLRPNQYVRVHLKGATRPNAILVPQRAVQQGSKGHFAWLVNRDGKAEQRPVVVGQWHGQDWLITEGLSPGEQVVVDGGLMLQPGVPLTVKEYSAPEPEPAGMAPGAGHPGTETTKDSK